MYIYIYTHIFFIYIYCQYIPFILTIKCGWISHWFIVSLTTGPEEYGTVSGRESRHCEDRWW